MAPITQNRKTELSFWERLAQRVDAPTLSAGDVWRGLERRAMQKPAQPNNLWAGLEERTDPQRYRPHAIPDVAEEQVQEGDQTLTVICSPRGNYLRLTPLQRDLWHQMDGTRTIAQLATQAFLKHKQLVPVGDFAALLKREGFLIDREHTIYHSISNNLERTTAEGFGRRVLRRLAGVTFNIPNLDAIYGAIYRGGGWLLFTPVFLGVWLLLVVSGLIAFGGLFWGGFASSYQVLSINGSVPLGLVTLWGALFVSFILHESAHALTVKHFKRTLHGGGVMLYYGMPAAFVDTSDIWRSPRRARIFVSAAGPMSDLLFGSLAALLALALARGDTTPFTIALGALCFKLAVTSYVAVLFNANPLLELDGYFILVDLLRFPDLRRRALAFVRGPLWQKLLQRHREGSAAQLSKEERILTIYGGLTTVYTIFAIIAAFLFWQEQLQPPIMQLLVGVWWEQLIGWALLLVVVAPILVAVGLVAWGLIRAGIGWIVQRGYGRKPELLTLVALLITFGMVILTTRIAEPSSYWVAPALWVIALATLLSLQPDYRGAAIAPALNLMLLTTICAALAAAMRALNTPYWVAPEMIAFVVLLLAGFGALLDVELRFVPLAELLSTALLLVLSFIAGGVALVLAEQNWPEASRLFHISASAPAYFGALAVALMLPRLFDLRDSRLIWSWVLLWFGTIVETGGYLVSLIRPIPALDVLVAGLWAAAWTVHLATLRQITPAEIRWPPGGNMSEAERLMRAFQYTYAGCYQLLRSVYGERRARAFDDRMDVIAATADWDVTLDRDRARIGEMVRRLPLDEQGSRYAEVLRYTVLMIQEITGEVFARRAIQAAYDALPWPERETASRLCFPDTPWARELSSSFDDIRSVRLRLLRQVDLFLSCDDKELAALAHTLQEQRAAPGTTLLRQGQASPGVWIIEAGEVLVKRDGEVIEELHRGDAFGAHELLEQRTSNSLYRTTVATTLIFIPAAEYEAVSREQAPHAAEALETAEVVRLLERVPIFANMPRNTLRHLAHMIERKQVPPKTIIVRQGRPSGMFYVIQHGQAAVLIRNTPETTSLTQNLAEAATKSHRVVATIGSKEFFGELELLRGTPPVASIVTTTETTLLALPHEAIRAILTGEQRVVRSLEQIGSDRLIALRGASS